MRKRERSISLFYIIVALATIGIGCAYATIRADISLPSIYETPPVDTVSVDETPATPPVHYPVSKTTVESYEELTNRPPVDLVNPENLSSSFEYDPVSNTYIMRTKVGKMDVCTPFLLNTNEYNDYAVSKWRDDYYRNKNAEAFEQGVDEFDFLDMSFNVDALDKVFGTGGVKIKTQGSVELSFGLTTNRVDNPTLSTYARNKTYFDFDEKIQANVTASVGQKVSFNMNYNTDATFDFDSQTIKLQYEGDEDEIIKNIEAGDVSMTTSSSLIRGGVSLFGIKSTMQFGKLTATALVAQQESETQTINTSGGTQTTEFDISIDKYDADRHFFLAHYFRNSYDNALSKLPYVASSVTINRVEIWVTNKQGDYTSSRNIVAFADLGENSASNCGSPESITSFSSDAMPANSANSLYSTLTALTDARDISLVNTTLTSNLPFLEGGIDYAKVESARPLSSSEYTLNSALGYISLNSSLSSDEVLGVSFEYTYGGKVYQVGEFAEDISASSSCLFVKKLKGTTVTTSLPIWDLMMKNIYSLGAYQVQEDNFVLNIQYLSDTTGTRLNYMPVGDISETILLQVMNADRLDTNDETNPDGFYDFIEGYTVLATTGRVIFPVIEPFGSHLKSKLGNLANADNYVFQELYDSTLTVAQLFTEKNKFYLKGEYQASSGSEIYLNAMNVSRGSVVVTAGGVTLTENVDYSVDYNMGIVRIENDSYISSGTPITVTLENQSLFSMQRKTMLGLDLSYKFNDNLTVGGTIMHLSETALTEKLSVGDEVLNNTLWGANVAYNTQFQWLTNWVDYLPFVTATAPSTLSVTGEFAQLVSSSDSDEGVAYIDDFESSQSSIDISSPYSWKIASTPYDDSSSALFSEAALSNDIAYGKNRALISWYYIDRLFTQQSSSTAPTHIKNDLDQLSDHYVREISYTEVYPNKELTYGESSVLQVLNLSYYPEERGPYNMDGDNVDTSTGNLLNPEDRWGGIMREMTTTDFESSNIEYIQFWVLDPFLNDEEDGITSTGGDLYFNLGEISEDILKDGMKSYENGLPTDGDTTYVTSTAWGVVPNQQSYSDGFDQSNYQAQDVGLDGLSDEDEATHTSYSSFLTTLKSKLSPTALLSMEEDRSSAINDPAGDNYHYYRSNYYDSAEASIHDRYKRYNGMEGNSLSAELAGDSYYTASTTLPDVEDVNDDNTLNEYERYYQYKVSMRPTDLVVGSNYVNDIQTSTVTLRNGKETTARWYQFKIPLSEYEKQVGSIQDFSSIRFARIFMTGFEKEVHLRFASLELVRGDWRNYTLALETGAAISAADLEMSVVNIEENAGQDPVNYVLPPGVTRVIDPSQTQLTQLNEQAMTLKVTNLGSEEAVAVYKSAGLDMRLYKRFEMFSHAEQFINDYTNLVDNEISLFIRLGSDNTSNYYEYEIPLLLTPEGDYDNDNASDRVIVWPEQNKMDFPLSLLTDLKVERNNAKLSGDASASYTSRYTIFDPDNILNKATIIGNPSLSDISTMMIGVRNNASTSKNVTVWVNEMAMTEFDEDGGWAAKSTVNLGVSDLATVNFSGYAETSGFGSIDQSLSERTIDDYYQYDFSTTVQLGRFLPEAIKLTAPLYYSYSAQITQPKYDPYNEDLLLSDVLEGLTSAQKDSVMSAVESRTTIESFSLSGVKFDIRSKSPMPYDPANFSFSYSQNKQNVTTPTTIYQNTTNRAGSISYAYSPGTKAWKPFSFIDTKSKDLGVLRDMSINYLPNSIALSTNMSRYYYEQQLSTVDGSGATTSTLPLSVSKNFLWDRQMAIQWNVIPSLQLSLSTTTGARVEESAGVVDKKLYAEEYELWCDTVKQSILELGTPWSYSQTFNSSFALPINKISIFDWVTSNLTYNATYSWDRGAYIDEDTDLGNSINNQGQWGVDGRLNLETLYNKSKFLKEVNTKFGSSKRANAPTKTRNFKRKIALKSDTTTLVRHGLKTKKIIVTAVGDDGKAYPLKFDIKDENSFIVKNRDTQKVTISVVPAPDSSDTWWYKTLQYTARGAMMVRTLSVSYQRTNTSYIPSFDTDIGDFLGQGDTGYGLSPGLDFAFGLTDETFVEEIADKGWLLMNDSLVTPSQYTLSENLKIDASLEPIKGLKITLSAVRSVSNNSETQFMYDGMPTVYSGNFSMTTIGLSSFFEKSSSDNGYSSSAFEKFQEYRTTITNRLEQAYSTTTYPYTGFMSDYPSIAGTAYNTTYNSVSSTSSDVMIPAFLAAYTGKSGDEVGLSAFPSLLSLLPNWKVSYSGLIDNIPALKKYLKTATLSHAYNCVYSVGSYESYLNWVGVNNGSNDMGYVYDEVSGLPSPSSAYSISSISLTESFSPLVGLNLTFKNSMTGKIEYKDSRTLSLNTTALQIVEATTSGLTLGTGYKIANLRALLKLSNSKRTTVSNDLNLSADFTFSSTQSLIRTIDEDYTQASSGSETITFKFSADYTLSKLITLQGYFDHQINNPLVSSTSYPVSNTNYGVTIRMSLKR